MRERSWHFSAAAGSDRWSAEHQFSLRIGVTPGFSIAGRRGSAATASKFPGRSGLRPPPNRCNMPPQLNCKIGDEMAAPIKFGVGQSVRRKEDDALIRGRGRYTDDVAPQPALHALVLRSPHAHAKFTINVAKARVLPGAAAILTADDVPDLADLPCLFNFEVDPFTGTPYPILPGD